MTHSIQQRRVSGAMEGCDLLTGDTRIRRRGRDVGLQGLLVERDREVTAIDEALGDARDGAGGVVLIEAPAGKGKSRLVSVAGDLAREADMQVVGAHGSELEREFPFGLAMQLFEPRLSAAGAVERLRLLSGPARRIAGMLAGEPISPGGAPDDRAYSVIHGLFWLCNNLLDVGEDQEATPLVMLVDDAQWADRPSLRFLAYLADRISELPVLLVVTLRSGELTADRQALAALRRASAGQTLRPGSLTADGVAAIVATLFPDAEPEFCRACATVTNGNPFLLTELLEQLRSDGADPTGATAERLSELAPDSVIHAVVPRVESLRASAQHVARAVAVLGSGASLGLVAKLIDLPLDEAAQGADALAAVHLFQPGSPLGFVHPLIAAAVRNSISPLDRGALHRRAATVLAEQGAAEDQVAAHLLAAPAQSDPSAVQALRIAARRALASGSAPSAVRMLERALAERPGPELHPEVLAELAEAECAAGLPRGVERLAQAISVTDDAEVRARLALAQARGHYEECRYREAAHVLTAALDQLGENLAVTGQLEAAYIAAAFFVPEFSAEAKARAQRFLGRISGQPSVAQLDALAHMAIHGALHCESHAAVTEMAHRAWGDGALLSATSLDGLSWPLVSGALLYVGELELSLEICERALSAAREQDSPTAYAAASYCRAWPLYEQGRLAEACADAEAGLDARPDGWRAYLRTAYAAIALCHVQRGALDQAETALSIIDHPVVREPTHLPSLLDARAQLRLAQHRADEALDDALQAGEALKGTLQAINPGAIAWRSTAALAQLSLGRSEAARQLAAGELEDALKLEIPRLIVRNLRILGLAERGEAGLELLGEAVARGDDCPPRLEHIHALIDFGAALRRANRRAAAREPLRRALELAHRGGALALANRARVELAAAGGRPRRIMLSGLDSLTPSERRVAEMASQSLTTRQVAEALFVTPKTVEFHLGNTYRKLEINSRAQLADLFGPGPDT